MEIGDQMSISWRKDVDHVTRPENSPVFIVAVYIQHQNNLGGLRALKIRVNIFCIYLFQVSCPFKESER